jgi:HAD superfamily hydrolase (TIGR01549 family)
MKTIALDIGKVCIDIHPERCFAALRLSKNREIPNILWKSISDMEKGLIDEKEWLKTFQEVTDNKFSDDELRNAYCQILGDERKEVEDFIKKAVSYNIRVIFFSDTSPIHINQLFRDLSFANLISGGIYSYESGCRKPDMKIYRKYEEVFGPPLLYIDDKKENIEAGKNAGWNSILFKSTDSLKEASSIFD